MLEVIYTSKANKQHRKRDQICVYRGGGGEEELDEGGQKVSGYKKHPVVR